MRYANVYDYQDHHLSKQQYVVLLLGLTDRTRGIDRVLLNWNL
jgi:hypothetical protein